MVGIDLIHRKGLIVLLSIDRQIKQQLCIELAHSLFAMLILMAHLGIGIRYWIGSQLNPVYMSAKIV